MPTYTYKNLSSGSDPEEYFEFFQSMKDKPFTHHPETGVPIQRIVSGGLGILGKPLKRSTVVNKNLAAATPCGCSKTALKNIMSPRGGIKTVSSKSSCSHSGHKH